MQDFKVYHENMVSTYNRLLNFHETLFTRIICVGMSGELKELQNTFQEGDTFHFQMEMFRDLEDINVKKLVAFYDQLEELMNSLANLNDIKEDDLEWEEE